MAKRLHYIDWLRVLAVMLLFPFHTLRVYDTVVDFYVKGSELSMAASYVIGFISRWHMPLLFLLAGMSTFFALKKRSGGEYARERVTRLLVPFVFGVLVLIPPQTWIGAKYNSGYTGSYWEYLTSGAFLEFNVQGGGDYYGGFGLGHLWFIGVLLLVSLVALPLLLWARGERGSAAFSRFAQVLAHPAGALLAAFLILIGDALPDFFGINPFYYAAFFLLGFAIMCDGAFADASVRYRWPAVLAGTALTVFWIASFEWRDSLPDPSVELAVLAYLGTLAAWLMIVGILGFGKKHLDFRTDALAYQAEASYPVYILHQTVIVLLAWWVVQLTWAWQLQWLVLLTVSVVATFAVYELVRRVGALRFLFGMRPRPKGTDSAGPA
jgi:peptidoglycan/LPS O-acetylase OafA/YrhL